jgi:hypothetical protein
MFSPPSISFLKTGIGTLTVKEAVPPGTIVGTFVSLEFAKPKNVFADLMACPLWYIHMPNNELLYGPFMYVFSELEEALWNICAIGIS